MNVNYETRLLARPPRHGPEKLPAVVDAAIRNLRKEGFHVRSVWATPEGVYATLWREG